MVLYYGAAYVNVPEPVAEILAINFFGISFLFFGVDLLMDFSDRLHSRKKIIPR